MKRVLVTGAATPLGRLLLQRLCEEPGSEKVIGIEPRAGRERVDGVELVTFELQDRELAHFLTDEGIDTVIHAGLAPARSGRPGRIGPADVIGTMCLCAAMGSQVRSLLLLSSSAVYPADPYAPLLQREDDPTDALDVEPAASLLEAEEYARDVAERVGHLDVAILRLAELAGGGLCGPLGSALLQPVLPVPLGYDPHVQWLHADDAVDAIVFAARLELAGIYNVASEGLLRWSEVLAIRGGRSAPVLPVEAGAFEPFVRRLGWPHVPVGAGNLLRFGSAVDIAKLRSADWSPSQHQRDCIRALS
jgi:UDP-glucose 4-epimerase